MREFGVVIACDATQAISGNRNIMVEGVVLILLINIAIVVAED